MKPYQSPDPIHLPGQADTPASLDDAPLTWGECAWALALLGIAAVLVLLVCIVTFNLILP